MYFAISTLAFSHDSVGGFVNPGETYTITYPPAFGTTMSGIRVGLGLGGPTITAASGLALSGEPFTIILETQGVSVLDKSSVVIHRGVWTGGPCPK
jgi:hypothetical protein